MKVDGKDMRPIWFNPSSQRVQVLDQRFLPHELVVKTLATVDETIFTLKEMVVRGAPLIGATGALGVYISLVQKGHKGADNDYLISECRRLKKDSTKGMYPVLTKLKDTVLYLKHNLNAKAVGVMGGEVDSIEQDVEKLIFDMNASVDEAEAFINRF